MFAILWIFFDRYPINMQLSPKKISIFPPYLVFTAHSLFTARTRHLGVGRAQIHRDLLKTQGKKLQKIL